MDEEVGNLKGIDGSSGYAGTCRNDFVKGIMSGKREVVVVRSGIGKVNMGICAQILIDYLGGIR